MTTATPWNPEGILIDFDRPSMWEAHSYAESILGCALQYLADGPMKRELYGADSKAQEVYAGLIAAWESLVKSKPRTGLESIHNTQSFPLSGGTNGNQGSVN